MYLQLFTYHNVIKLLKNGLFSEAFILFIFSSWIAVIFSINIDMEFRLFLTELVFQSIFILRTNFPMLKKQGTLQKAGNSLCSVTLSEEQYMLRMMNTLVATGISLTFGEDFLRLDAIGTHLVENTIGIARMTSNDPRWSRILTTYGHAEI